MEDKKVEQKPAKEVKESKEPEVKVPEEKPQVEKLQTLDDGSFHEWTWDQPDINQEPLFHVGLSALNLGSLNCDKNMASEIIQLALNILQSDNHQKLFKFLREELTRVPQSGDPLFSLRKNLFYQYQQLREEVKHHGK